MPTKEPRLGKILPSISHVKTFCGEITALPIWSERGPPAGAEVPGYAWVSEAGAARPAQAQPTPLMLGPLDTLEVDAILHHLPERTHFSKSLHMVDALLHGVVHLLLCREAADAKPDRGVC